MSYPLSGDKNWKFNKLPTSNVPFKQRAVRTRQVSRNFAWDSSSVAHLLKRTTTGTSIDEINFFCFKLYSPKGYEKKIGV